MKLSSSMYVLLELVWHVDDNDRSTSTANSVPVAVWNGSGALDSEPGWFDEQTQSLWMSSSGKLLRISLDVAGWVERACGIVGRDFTQDEWDRFVPGNEPLRSVCA